MLAYSLAEKTEWSPDLARGAKQGDLSHCDGSGFRVVSRFVGKAWVNDYVMRRFQTPSPESNTYL